MFSHRYGVRSRHCWHHRSRQGTLKNNLFLKVIRMYSKKLAYKMFANVCLHSCSGHFWNSNWINMPFQALFVLHSMPASILNKIVNFFYWYWFKRTTILHYFFQSQLHHGGVSSCRLLCQPWTPFSPFKEGDCRCLWKASHPQVELLKTLHTHKPMSFYNL